MKPKTMVVAVCALLLALSSSTTIAVALAGRAIGTSDHRWCTALELITSKPVPKPTDPHKNPSREQNYQAYVAFLQLRREFGCD